MLDRTDMKILRVLQEDGRITNQDLSSRCNMSPSACFDRVKRLREEGYITGYTALLNPIKLDRALLIFVEVLLDKTTGDMFEKFAESAARVPEIMECHMVAGGFDYLLKVRVQDMKAYRVFLGEVLVEMPGVRETRTYAVLEQIKSTTCLPI